MGQARDSRLTARRPLDFVPSWAGTVQSARVLSIGGVCAWRRGRRPRSKLRDVFPPHQVASGLRVPPHPVAICTADSSLAAHVLETCQCCGELVVTHGASQSPDRRTDAPCAGSVRVRRCVTVRDRRRRQREAPDFAVTRAPLRTLPTPRPRMAFKRSGVRLSSAPFYHPHHSQCLALARLNHGRGS